MKKILLLLSYLAFAFTTMAQVDLSNYSQILVEETDSSSKPMLSIITCFSDAGLGSLRSTDSIFPDYIRAELSGDSIDTQVLSSVDSMPTYFFATGINVQNAKNFEYRVSERYHKVIKDWQMVTQFNQVEDTMGFKNTLEKGDAFLGGFKIDFSNYIFVEIRKKGSKKPIETIAVYKKQVQPEINTIGTIHSSNFPVLVVESFQQDFGGAIEFLHTLDENGNSKNLPKKIETTPHIDNLIFHLAADIYERNAIEYSVIKDGKVLIDWKPNDYDADFIWLQNLEHGEYALQMRYAVQRHNITTYPFSIKPAWYQMNRYKVIFGGMALLFVGFLVLLFFFLRQKNRQKKDRIKSEKLQNELKAIRSQLNPHFIFNALSSIQGLMNKSDINNANYYLTEFSSLLRESLLSNQKEFVPLKTELKTLETYVKLEQLRFPFEYALSTSDDLDLNSLEVPYLLIQPLVENAIKHGVSNLYEQGKISISVFSQEKDMIIEVKDNGKGFNTEGVFDGLGLKLTKERIRLLNQADSVVHLSLESNEIDATTARIIFENWL